MGSKLRKTSALATALVLALSTTSAFAQSTTTTTATGSGVNSNSGSYSGSQVNVQGDTVYSGGKTKSTVRSTASAIAPGLTAAGVQSCAGSATVGVGAVGFGFSGGATYEMIECNRRAYAATLAGMGQNLAALALVCNNPEVMSALNVTGVVCPQQKAAQEAAAQQAALAAQQRSSIFGTPIAATTPVVQQVAVANAPAPTRAKVAGNPCQTSAGPACDQWIRENYASLQGVSR